MSYFRKRMWINVTLLALATAALLRGYAVFAPKLSYFVHLTGWLLFALMLVLTAYNGRKKLPFLPLGRSESWLQFHIYLGFFAVVLFLAHLRFRMPTGWFEGTLAALYLAVTLSGVAGLAISRLFPKRLTTRGGEVLFERIPSIRNALQQEAETLALHSVADAKSTTIASFYATELAGFFAGPKNWWAHLFEIRRPLNLLLNNIDNLNRYTNEKERQLLERLAQLVRQKDGLDYHYATQSVLKGWLFVHIPLTYSLLLFTLVHIVLIFAFSGGTP